MISHLEGQCETALPFLARLACVLTQPLKYVHNSRWEFPKEICEKLGTFAKNEAFKWPLQKALSERLRLSDTGFSIELVECLNTDRNVRISAMITGAEPDELDRAARILAAAIMRRHLSRLVSRADRERAISVFGNAAFQIAIREAGFLYGDLDRLCSEPPPELDAEDGTGGNRIAPAVEPGYRWLYAFVSVSNPMLGDMFSCRLPRGLGLPPDRGRLDARCRSQLAKLLGRRMPGWSHCIA